MRPEIPDPRESLELSASVFSFCCLDELTNICWQLAAAEVRGMRNPFGEPRKARKLGIPWLMAEARVGEMQMRDGG